MLKKVVPKIAVFVVSLILATSLTACSNSQNVVEVLKNDGVNGYDEEGFAIVPDNDFHTAFQYTYILSNDLTSVTDYAVGLEELSRPRPLTLDFTDDKNVKDSPSYVLQYADNLDFNNYEIVYLSERKFDLYNLRLNQDVYWRVGVLRDDVEKGTVYHFKVADKGPRNLFVDGVTNVRDIGGYDSFLVDGGKIRQGLFYRGAQLNDITEEGIETLVEVLGVRQEIDIRNAEDMISPFKDSDEYGVSYCGVEIRNGTERERFFEFEEEYKTIFSIIANAAEAPVYLHCQAGADRTGLNTFMLMALCGVSYEDMAKDYMFTNFSVDGVRNLNGYHAFLWWWEELQKIDGIDHAEKAANWLRTKGVTDEDIEVIRATFVEGY